MQQFDTPLHAADWLSSCVAGELQTDSRRVRPGDGFIAWPGAAADAREFVKDARQQGASACLVEQEGVERYGFEAEGIAAYAGLKAASGPIAAAYFETPSAQIKVLAVTGTNGKTSTSWWLAQALTALDEAGGMSCALVGTLGLGRFGQPLHATGLTTPDPVLLQKSLRHFVQSGLKTCAMEASSIGLAEHRVAGTRIHTAMFTNFTQDHLDYHGSMAIYWSAKAALFDWPGLVAAVVNIDDEQGLKLAGVLATRDLDLWTYSAQTEARLQAKDIVLHPEGLHFTVSEALDVSEREDHPLATRLLGGYNVSNVLCVIAGMRSLGISLASAVQACHSLQAVPGRMECINQPGHPLVVVDYAHTPDALAKALQALRPVAQGRSGVLWCVFGCGGQRDPIKRPLMGAIAAQHADRVVVTSDNPRNESPLQIISQILLGLEGYAGLDVQSDRALAIAQTVGAAQACDVILIAGKGHEGYQELNGSRLEFSDLLHARQALQLRQPARGGAL